MEVRKVNIILIRRQQKTKERLLEVFIGNRVSMDGAEPVAGTGTQGAPFTKIILPLYNFMSEYPSTKMLLSVLSSQYGSKYGL